MLESTAVIIQHDIPNRLVTLPDEIQHQTRDLLTRADAVGEITSAEQFEDADDLCGKINRHEKQIEEARRAVKQPVLDLGRAIDAACKDALAPLNAARKRLGASVLEWQKKERARLEAERQERERLAREKAEAEARAEQERLRAEAAERQRREAEAAELLGDVAPEAQPVEQIEVRPAAVHVPAAPAPKAASVNVRRVKKLVIDNPCKIPIRVGGHEVRPIDEAALRRVLLSGFLCEGARIEEVEEVVGRGR